MDIISRRLLLDILIPSATNLEMSSIVKRMKAEIVINCTTNFKVPQAITIPQSEGYLLLGGL